MANIADLELLVNGNSKGFINLDVIGGIPDRNFADDDHKFVYLPVVSSTGKTWLNNNLGADYSNMNHSSFDIFQQATSIIDFRAYGSVFQWGRYSDGHDLINWVSATASDNTEPETQGLSSSNTPGHGSFITSSSGNWRSPANNSLWSGEAGINNPCPQGYRVPTSSEWNAERVSWSSSNIAGAYASPLKLQTVRSRWSVTGGISASKGYWVDPGRYRSFLIDDDVAELNNVDQGNAMPVRCIKN
jgi:hypothetical protein